MTKVASILGSLALAVVLVAAGFFACLAPPATRALASINAKVDVSPFGKEALVAVADATRDYAFGAHDLEALYGVILDVNQDLQDSLRAAGDAPAQGSPRLTGLGTAPNLALLAGTFADASEQYVFSVDTISHLDDCHGIVRFAYPLLAVVAVVAVACLVYVGRRCGKRTVGAVFRAAGIVVLAAFVALGVRAATDFDGFFTLFHQVFFSQGNWTFPSDSLLICALPTGFWAGMAAFWLVVSVALAFFSIWIGGRLRRIRATRAKRSRKAE